MNKKFIKSNLKLFYNKQIRLILKDNIVFCGTFKEEINGKLYFTDKAGYIEKEDIKEIEQI